MFDVRELCALFFVLGRSTRNPYLKQRSKFKVQSSSQSVSNKKAAMDSPIAAFSLTVAILNTG
jgi:hypothetical protein